MLHCLRAATRQRVKNNNNNTKNFLQLHTSYIISVCIHIPYKRPYCRPAGLWCPGSGWARWRQTFWSPSQTSAWAVRGRREPGGGIDTRECEYSDVFDQQAVFWFDEAFFYLDKLEAGMEEGGLQQGLDAGDPHPIGRRWGEGDGGVQRREGWRWGGWRRQDGREELIEVALLRLLSHWSERTERVFLFSRAAHLLLVELNQQGLMWSKLTADLWEECHKCRRMAVWENWPQSKTQRGQWGYLILRSGSTRRSWKSLLRNSSGSDRQSESSVTAFLRLLSSVCGMYASRGLTECKQNTNNTYLSPGWWSRLRCWQLPEVVSGPWSYWRIHIRTLQTTGTVFNTKSYSTH